MFLYFFLLCILLPLVEIFFIFYLSDLWGWSTSLVLILISGIIGVSLVKREGIQTFGKIQDAVVRGRSPASQLLEALCLLLGGLLLIVPGFITDLMGFVMVMPYSRRLFSLVLQKKWKNTRNVWVHSVSMGDRPYRDRRPPSQEFDEDVIEVKAIDVVEISSESSESGDRPKQ